MLNRCIECSYDNATHAHTYRGQIQGYSQPSREERQKFNLRRPSLCQAMQQVWPVRLETKTNNSVHTGFVSVSLRVRVCVCVAVCVWVLFKWNEQHSFIYLFVRATTKKPQQIIMKIKIINHLQGTSKGSSSSSSRRTTTASADRQRTNNIAHTPRCRTQLDATRLDSLLGPSLAS